MEEKKFKTLVIIPVYNEGNRIKTVLEKFKGIVVDKVLVVNDGSTDSTPKVIKSFGVEAVSHPQRQGVGSSIRDGIDYARENGFELVVVMAGNGKDDPERYPSCFDP